MTVLELKTLLAGCPDDAEVAVFSREELKPRFLIDMEYQNTTIDKIMDANGFILNTLALCTGSHSGKWVK